MNRRIKKKIDKKHSQQIFGYDRNTGSFIAITKTYRDQRLWHRRDHDSIVFCRHRSYAPLGYSYQLKSSRRALRRDRFKYMEVEE